MVRQQQGFSIIEIIIVITILVILALTAAPKLLDSSEAAYASQRATVVATFQTSVSNVKTMWNLDGRPAATSNNNGATVELNSTTTVTIDDNYGYPVGDRGSDRVNNFNLRDCEDVFNDLVDHDFSTARRGQVNNSNFKEHDIIVTRENASPDICHYTWSQTIDSRPANSAPSQGQGFSYNPVTGTIMSFDFT